MFVVSKDNVVVTEDCCLQRLVVSFSFLFFFFFTNIYIYIHIDEMFQYYDTRGRYKEPEIEYLQNNDIKKVLLDRKYDIRYQSTTRCVVLKQYDHLNNNDEYTSVHKEINELQ
jgi:hypothetical protein